VNSPSTVTVAPTQPETPILRSVDNFRDLAGDGYQTRWHDRLRRAVVYRSNVLLPNDKDYTTLNLLGLEAVYDLRSSQEVEKQPDHVPAGATLVRVNIMGDSPGALAVMNQLSSAAQAESLLSDIYGRFVSDVDQRAQFAVLLRDVAASNGPILIHCSAGKDRTGWASALLLSIADVPRQTIMHDYLLTNEYEKSSINDIVAETTRQRGRSAGEAIKVLMSAAPELLDKSFAEADHEFGSMDGYLRVGLGLSEDTLQAIKHKLTTSREQR
jgi:protein-tyrosine phosphatase